MKKLFAPICAALVFCFFAFSSHAMNFQLSCTTKQRCHQGECQSEKLPFSDQSLFGELEGDVLFLNGSAWKRLSNQKIDEIDIETFLLVFPSGEHKVLTLNGANGILSSTAFGSSGSIEHTTLWVSCDWRPI